MKNFNMNYLMVGGFTLLSLAGLVFFVLLLRGQVSGADLYITRFHNVHGIAFGTRVYFQGFLVGRVEDVQPVMEKDEMAFRVELAIKRDWRIPRDSVARVMPTGLLSAISVQIMAGSDPAFLAPGDTIVSREPLNLVNTFGNLSEEFTRLSQAEDGIENLLRRANRFLQVTTQLVEGDGQALASQLVIISRALATRLPGLLDRLEQTSAGIQQMMGATNQQHVGHILQQMDDSTGQLARLLGELRGMRQEVAGLLAGVREVVTGMNHLMVARRDDLDQTLGDLHHILSTTASRIDGIAVNLENATHNFSEFSHTVREQPSLLIRGQTRMNDGEGP